MELTREQKIEKIEKYDVITFRNIHGKNAGKQSFGPTKNVKTGRFMGIPNFTKKQEEDAVSFFLDKHSNIELKDGKELVIHNEDGVDKAYWDMLKYSSEIAFSAKEAIANKVAYYIEVKELEHKEGLDEKITVHKAVGLILNDTHSELIFRARMLKLDMENDPTETIKAVLIDIAEKNPAKIINLYAANLIGVKLLFYKAVDNNVITKDGAGKYKYDINILGVDEETSLTYLQHNDSKLLLERLKGDVDKAMDSRLFGEKEKKNEDAVIVDVPDNVFNESDELVYDRLEFLKLNLVQLKKNATILGVKETSTRPMRKEESVCDAIEKHLNM